MSKNPISTRARALGLIGCSAIALTCTTSAFAADTIGLEEIVVTAQKREQNLQDVPIAVTALSNEAIKVNRVTSLMDLGALAPNLNVRATLGGNQAPTYTMRGSVTYGTVPGQDKTISTYLDGVYLGGSSGGAFDLPDLERIEVLRGPQGTLFGRNSTAGAISITTRDPGDKFGVRQQFTVGNYREFRSSTRVDLGAWGPFSASVSYTHDQRRGDVKNLSAGMVWNYKNALPGSWIEKISHVSPQYLGDKNSDSVFVAVKFEPSDSFKTTYKFDFNSLHFTPEANQLVAYSPAVVSLAFPALFANFLNAQIAAVPPVTAGQHRPDTAYNGFTLPGYVRTMGHNLTSTYRVSDAVTIKNILAFRNSGSIVVSSVGGYDLPLSAAAATAGLGFLGAAGDSFSFFGSPNEGHHDQWSDEVQVNYNSKMLTLTAGGIYYHANTRFGTVPGLKNGYFTAVSPAGLLAGGQLNYVTYRGSSTAGYLQAELHVTPQLDIVGGYRLTHDNKRITTYLWRTKTNSFGDPLGQNVIPSDYKGTKSSFMGTINYKPTDDILVYAKYATGYVSGGSISRFAFAPETARSWEAGIKADLFDRRLRANLALFDVKYDNLQAVSGGRFVNPPDSDIGSLLIREGDLHAKGFEFELTAAPVKGLTLNAATGYTHYKETNINPVLPSAAGFFEPTVRPNWTVNLGGQYDTQPLFDEAYLSFHVDGAWRSKSLQLGKPPYPAAWNSIIYSDPMWIVNGRVSLRNIPISTAKAELALWVKNLTDADNPGQSVDFGFAAISSYTPARTFGADLTIEF